MPLTHPDPHWTVKPAHAHGVEIIGDTEIFIVNGGGLYGFACHRHHRHKREMTTTALTHHFLETVGLNAVCTAEIRRPFWTSLPSRMGGTTCWNCRYQIDLTPSLDPDAGILLNVTPDHLDRHGTLENYASVQEKIFAHPAEAGTAVIGADDAFCNAIAARAAARGLKIAQISAGHPVCTGIYAEGSELFEMADGIVTNRAQLAGIGSLRGAHNARTRARRWPPRGAWGCLGTSLRKRSGPSRVWRIAWRKSGASGTSSS